MIGEKRTAEQWDGLKSRARFLKANGDSVRVIARKLGVSVGAVGDWTRGMDEEPTYYVDCAKCGERFTASRSHATYCSERCARRARAWRAWERQQEKRNAA